MATQVRISTTMKAKDGRLLKVRGSTIAEVSQREVYRALNITSRAGQTIKTFA